MSFRKTVASILAAAFLVVSVPTRSHAVALPPAIAAGTAFGTGASIATGFLGVVAIICMYDIYLKSIGAKNWDGTPKSTKSTATKKRS